MTDTEHTVPTLRERPNVHQALHDSMSDGAVAKGINFDKFLGIMQAPLQAEIARLKATMNKTISGEWIPGVLAVQMSDKDAEIVQLRSKVAAADAMRSEIRPIELGISLTAEHKHYIQDAIKAYDAAPVAESTRAGIPEESNDEHARGAAEAGRDRVPAQRGDDHDAGVSEDGTSDREHAQGVAAVGHGDRDRNISGGGDSASDNLTATPAVMSHYGHVDYYGPLSGPLTTPPPAVADAGETGEKMMSRYSREDYSEREIEEMEREDAGETGEDGRHLHELVSEAMYQVTGWRNVPTGIEEPVAQEMIRPYREENEVLRDQLTALRRDVEALKELKPLLNQRDQWAELTIQKLAKRLTALESRECSELGEIAVTDAMVDAFWSSWGSAKLAAFVKEPLRNALSAALAARGAGQ